MLPAGDRYRRLLRRGPTGVASLTFFCLLLLAFAWQLFLSPGSVFVPTGLVFVPGTLFGGVEQAAGIVFIPPPATLVSYQFLHADWLHLLGNLLFLWVFGPKVEERCGPGCWTVLLLACGMAAALTQAWPDPSSSVMMVGAGGGISGILGAYLFLYRHDDIRFPGAVVAAWFLAQLLDSTWAGSGAGAIAFRAHVGGFVCGLLLAAMLHSATLLSADARAVARTLRSRDSSH